MSRHVCNSEEWLGIPDAECNNASYAIYINENYDKLRLHLPRDLWRKLFVLAKTHCATQVS